MDASETSSSLHILVLDPQFQDASRPGSSRSFDIVARLVLAGYRVTVLTTTAGLPAGGGRRLTMGGAEVIACRVPAPNGWLLAPRTLLRFAFWSLFRMWRVSDVDAVLAVAPSPALLPAPAAFALWRGIPLIAELRQVPPPDLPAEAPRHQRYAEKLAVAARRLALWLPRRLIAASPQVAAALAQDRVRPERQTQIGLGCDIALMTFAPGSDRHLLAELTGRPVIVYAGRFTADRELAAALTLAGALKEWAPEAVMVLCGEGPARATLIAHARYLGSMDEAVRIIGPIPRRELAELFAAATVALTLPDRNGTSGGFFDALAAGRPVVVMGDDWERELVESRGAGFGLPMDQPRAAARELAEILRDADGLRRAELQTAALAAGRFNLDRIAGDVRMLIEKVVAEDPRAAVMRRRGLRAKRVLDVAVAALGLIVLSPVMVVIAILVAAKLGWPVLFSQERIGSKGRPFRIYKFRTMTTARDSSGAPLPDEERITPLGAFLRRTSLDEMPELFNVLIGQMSLVGPRPLLPEYLPYYTPEQRRRHDLRPGVTGLSQIKGRNSLSWEEKFAYDVDYVDRFSFGLDLKILAQTVLAVLTGRGVNAPGHATMPRFDEVMARRQGAEDV